MISLLKAKSVNRFKHLTGHATWYGIQLTCRPVSAGPDWLSILIHLGCYSTTLYIVTRIGVSFMRFEPALLLGIFFMMLLQRFSCLSEFQAAKNMVIQAIQKGIPLELSEVRKLPRFQLSVKPSMYALIFIGFFPFCVPDTVISVPALLLFYASILPISWAMEALFLTRHPSDRHLEEALQTGRIFLERMNIPKD